MSLSSDKLFLYNEKGQKQRDLSAELSELEGLINDLKAQYEQYFAGILPLAPEKAYSDVKRLIRELMRAPFRSSAQNYRLKALKNRFSSLDTYWQRVLKQREEGTYSKDVFKANLREKNARDEARAVTSQGMAERQLTALFDSYRSAVEKQNGVKTNLDYESFQKMVVSRAKDFKQKNTGKKLAFKVVVKNGKVTIQARVKGEGSGR